MLSLPAATTTVVPRSVARVMALCIEAGHARAMPRLMLITSTGWGFSPAPQTVSPDNQSIARTMSEVQAVWSRASRHRAGRHDSHLRRDAGDTAIVVRDRRDRPGRPGAVRPAIWRRNRA